MTISIYKQIKFYYYKEFPGQTSSLDKNTLEESSKEFNLAAKSLEPTEKIFSYPRFLDLKQRVLELYKQDKEKCLSIITLLAGNDGIAGTDTGITINSSLEDIKNYLQKVETTNYSAANLGGNQANLAPEIETLDVPKSNLTNSESIARKGKLMGIISGQIVLVQNEIAAAQERGHWLTDAVTKAGGKETSADSFNTYAKGLEELYNQLNTGQLNVAEANQQFQALMQKHTGKVGESLNVEASTSGNIAFGLEQVKTLSETAFQIVLSKMLGDELGAFGSVIYNNITDIMQNAAAISKEKNLNIQDPAVLKEAVAKVYNQQLVENIQSPLQQWSIRKFGKALPPQIARPLACAMTSAFAELSGQVIEGALSGKNPIDIASNLTWDSVFVSFLLGAATGKVAGKLEGTNASGLLKTLADGSLDGTQGVFEKLYTDSKDNKINFSNPEYFKEIIAAFVQEAGAEAVSGTAGRGKKSSNEGAVKQIQPESVVPSEGVKVEVQNDSEEDNGLLDKGSLLDDTQQLNTGGLESKIEVGLLKVPDQVSENIMLKYRQLVELVESSLQKMNNLKGYNLSDPDLEADLDNLSNIISSFDDYYGLEKVIHSTQNREITETINSEGIKLNLTEEIIQSSSQKPFKKEIIQWLQNNPELSSTFAELINFSNRFSEAYRLEQEAIPTIQSLIDYININTEITNPKRKGLSNKLISKINETPKVLNKFNKDLNLKLATINSDLDYISKFGILKRDHRMLVNDIQKQIEKALELRLPVVGAPIYTNNLTLSPKLSLENRSGESFLDQQNRIKDNGVDILNTVFYTQALNNLLSEKNTNNKFLDDFVEDNGIDFMYETLLKGNDGKILNQSAEIVNDSNFEKYFMQFNEKQRQDIIINFSESALFENAEIPSIFKDHLEYLFSQNIPKDSSQKMVTPLARLLFTNPANFNSLPSNFKNKALNSTILETSGYKYKVTSPVQEDFIDYFDVSIFSTLNKSLHFDTFETQEVMKIIIMESLSTDGEGTKKILDKMNTRFSATNNKTWQLKRY